MNATDVDTARLGRAIIDVREDEDDDARADACAAAVFSCLVEPGDAAAGALIGAVGARLALQMVIEDAITPRVLEAAELTPAAMHAARARWLPRLQQEPIEFALHTAARHGIHLLVPADAHWPRALGDLGAHAPVCLWVRGDPAALTRSRVAVAIVGARAASGYGEHIAAEFAADLAGRGITIVSGAAYGIDGAAHRGALSVQGLTVALLAGGVDRPYPAGHVDLLTRIAATGAVASEVPCGSAPTKWRFLQRNRTIAALGGATVVVEAGRRSGSLNTAGHAASLGRSLGAVPGPVTSGSSAGCHRLLREFDATCVTTADEVAELLGLADAAGDESAGDRQDPRRVRVTDALSSRSWRELTDIARRCGMANTEAATVLGMMLLDGIVQSQGGAWRRAPAAGTC